MIRQFSALCRVKELREEKLALAVEAKRREIRSAERELAEARENSAAFRSQFAEREQAIYAELIGRIELPDAFELAREKVRRLEAEQQRLDDLARQAERNLLELRQQLSELRDLHRTAQIERDKYHTTRQELVIEARLQSEAKEESEQEETAGMRLLAAS